MVKKILIVDDDRELVDVYKEILVGEGFEVDTALEGEEGLKKIRNNQYNLIVLDIMLPRIDGIALLSEIRENMKSDVPIAMLTNFGQGDLIKKALTLGATEILLKYNLTPGEVGARITQMFSQNPQP